jgi:hypothetical protein
MLSFEEEEALVKLAAIAPTFIAIVEKYELQSRLQEIKSQLNKTETVSVRT